MQIVKFLDAIGALHALDDFGWIEVSLALDEGSEPLVAGRVQVVVESEGFLSQSHPEVPLLREFRKALALGFNTFASIQVEVLIG